MGINDFLLILSEAYKQNDMVAVYSDPSHPECAAVGYIDSLSAKQLALKHVTPEGISDGYVIRRIEDVFRIDVNGEYERRLTQLYQLHNQQHEDFFPHSMTPQRDLFREGLIIAQERNFVVSICMDETEEQMDLVGFVKEVRSQTVTLSRISIDGFDDGESTIFIDDIIKMNCNTANERNLKLLFEYQNSSLT